MPGHDIILIGASAGGVEAIPEILSRLPRKLRAAVFVVLHVSPQAPSAFPKIIARVAKMRAAHAVDGEKIEHSRIYVAPADFHLWIESGRVRVVRGPKENRHRPAVDPLFRSAATAYGRRVVGVILTGALDDGTHGLDAVKKCGGVTIVQNPEEAFAPSMPLSALRYVEVDHVLSLAQIPPLLVRLVKTASKTRRTPDCEPTPKFEDITKNDVTLDEMNRRMGVPSAYICPECSGPLWEINNGKLPHFRCFVGHAFSPESLLDGESENLERALWTAVKTLEERASFLEKMAARSDKSNQVRSMENYRERAKEHRRDAKLIRRIVGHTRKAA
jgi:two-component system, chemotaxis family, protein-glutamate methylesterase/glutaminase